MQVSHFVAINIALNAAKRLKKNNLKTTSSSDTYPPVPHLTASDMEDIKRMEEINMKTLGVK